ncbi:MAG: 3-hydroxyacyl-ACP dehydratase [Flavobacteriaceae bacterium]|jgi:3-hydroxyacyl-[acyl-carrier-protein] dehydratase|nr:3-hydroxyacyl-ACP dehydratase [Flavobacteriaceae bacterium]|tara:strand:+ start:1038 stop:1415 length:378 start_codon:yes stop_codon:yes gene_type:complete
MDLKDFYTITNRQSPDANTLQVQLQLNANHKIFKGHFPDHPVLPGVAMLQIIKELSASHFKKSLFMKAAQRVKFINLVAPQQHNTLVFNLAFQQDKDLLKVKNSTTFVDETPVMNCTITYQIQSK